MPDPLPQLSIGNVPIGFPVVQAALSGYSDWPARAMARQLGAPFAFAEVMLDRFVLNVSKGRKARRYLGVADDDHPCGAQLMGNEGEDLAAAALKLASVGFDVIDVNFGCPVKKVLGRRRGGYLLGQPKAAMEIVARVRDALPPEVPLSVKMRRGLDDDPRSLDHFYAIFDGAFRLGAAAITVHGRTVRQRYEGASSWEFLRELKQHAGTRTVLGSGDLFSAAACLDMIAQTGVDGVTAARGAIGNPWIFSQARALADGRPAIPPSLAEQRWALAEHFRLAKGIYGARRCPFLMRKFGIKYSQHHPRADQVRAAFVAVRSAEHWAEVLDTWYETEAPGEEPTDAPTF